MKKKITTQDLLDNILIIMGVLTLIAIIIGVVVAVKYGIWIYEFLQHRN